MTVILVDPRRPSLVPVEAGAAERVPLGAEQTVEQIVRSSSMGAAVTLLRVLITRAAAFGHPLVLVLSATSGLWPLHLNWWR